MTRLHTGVEAKNNLRSLRLNSESVQRDFTERTRDFELVVRGLSVDPETFVDWNSWKPLLEDMKSMSETTSSVAKMHTMWKVLPCWTSPLDKIDAAGGSGIPDGPIDANVVLLRLWGLTITPTKRCEFLGSSETLVLLSCLAQCTAVADKTNPKLICRVLKEVLEAMFQVETEEWKQIDCYLYGCCVVAGLILHAIRSRWQTVDPDLVASTDAILEMCLQERCARMIPHILRALISGPGAVKNLAKGKGYFSTEENLAFLSSRRGKHWKQSLVVSTEHGWMRFVSATRVDIKDWLKPVAYGIVQPPQANVIPEIIAQTDGLQDWWIEHQWTDEPGPIVSDSDSDNSDRDRF